MTTAGCNTKKQKYETLQTQYHNPIEYKIKK